MTEHERALAEEAMAFVPSSIHALRRSFPGIGRQLERIDAVAVAYLAVCRAAQTYDPEKSARTTYFSRAVRNALLKEIGKRRRVVLDGPNRIPLSEADALTSRPPDTIVAIAVAFLPKEALRLIRLRYWDAKSLTEIASIDGCTRSTVRRRLGKAVAALRTVLEIHARKPRRHG